MRIRSYDIVSLAPCANFSIPGAVRGYTTLLRQLYPVNYMPPISGPVITKNVTPPALNVRNCTALSQLATPQPKISQI